MKLMMQIVIHALVTSKHKYPLPRLHVLFTNTRYQNKNTSFYDWTFMSEKKKNFYSVVKGENQRKYF